MSWETSRLREVARVDARTVQPDTIDGDAIYIGLEHIGHAGALDVNTKAGAAKIKSAKNRFDTRHILFGKLRPNLGKVARPVIAGVCSTDIYPLLPREGVDRAYLCHYLLSPEAIAYSSSRTTGVNLPRVSWAALGDLPIPLPPLPEQRRIAAILDEADRTRRLRKDSLDGSELEIALFSEHFGDPVVNPKGYERHTLGEISLKFSDGPFGSNLKSAHYTDTGVRVVRLQNIGVRQFDDRDKAYIDTAHFQTLAKHELRADDVVIGTLGDPILRACKVPTEVLPAINKADCIQLRVDPAFALPAYVVGALNHPTLVRAAESLSHGQTRSRISGGQLRGLIIPVPPPEHQAAFERDLQAVLRQVERYALQLEDLDALFSSLQHRAFRGEL